MVKVFYKHWKKDIVLEVTGDIIYDNPISDRIVVVDIDGKHEDIIRNTIIKIETIGD